MTDAEIKALILELIREIAPEVDTLAVRDHDDVREAFDLDSMDFTNLVVAIHERTKIDIPESDYNKLFTLASSVAYLQDAMARSFTRD